MFVKPTLSRCFLHAKFDITRDGGLLWGWWGAVLLGVDLVGFETWAALSSLFLKEGNLQFCCQMVIFFLQTKIKASNPTFANTSWKLIFLIRSNCAVSDTAAVTHCNLSSRFSFLWGQFFSLAPSIRRIHLYLATKEAARGMIFHSTMHLTSIGAAGMEQFRKADLWFSVYRCNSKLHFRHVNLKMFDLKSFSPFSLLPALIWSLL